MKKIFSILLLAFLAVSCSYEDVIDYFVGDTVTEGQVQVGISVMTTEAPVAVSRALGNDPDIRSLKVVVYDQNGIYVEQTDATLDAVNKKWFATMSLSDSERRIHLLANYTDEVPYGLDEQEIAKISTTQDVYWQKVVLADITASVVGDPANPQLQLNNPERLEGIKLIRNFAKVTVMSDVTVSDLEIESAGLYNVPDQGSLAPYAAESGKFVDGYLDYAQPSDLISAHYAGNEPVSYNLVTPTSFTDATDNGSYKEVSMFCFERETPQADAPFVIIKGKFHGSMSSSYYKINLRANDEDYFPILRNFDYVVQITAVNGAGYASLDDAVASAGSGDISTDLRFRNLTNISNGEARIFVSHTEMVLVSAQKVEIKYSFYPDMINDPTLVKNEQVEVTLGAPSPLGAVFSDMSKISVQNSVKDSDGFSVIQLTPNEPSEVAKKQTLILTGKYDVKVDEVWDAEEGVMVPVYESHTITREVEFTLREKPQLKAYISKDGTPTSEIAETKETKFDLMIGVPDGLSEAMFPLNLAIEARELTITPQNVAGNHLPSTTGQSAFGSNTPGFQFVKTLSYTDYKAVAANAAGYKYFTAKFKTNVAASATDIVVTNESFNPGITYFTNGGAHTYKFDYFDLVSMPGDKAQVQFNMPDKTPVTVRLNNLEPDGKNADRLTYVSPGVYTYTPSSEGMQVFGLAFQVSGRAYEVKLQATDYTEVSKAKLGVGHPTDWYTKSDYTTQVSPGVYTALIPGFTTTVTARVSFNSSVGRSVSFKVGGETKAATWQKTDDGYEYYTCTYTVPATQASAGVTVEVTATDETGSSTVDFDNMVVWKANNTVGSTAITTADNLSAASQGETMNAEGNKKIWKGIVLQSAGYNTSYLFNNKDTDKLVVKNNNTSNDLTTSVNYAFLSNGSNYLQTFTGKYLNITATNNGDASSRHTLVDSKPTTVTLTPYYDRWAISLSSDNRRVLYANNATTLYVNRPTTANINANTNNYKWRAYPVTVEYKPW